MRLISATLVALLAGPMLWVAAPVVADAGVATRPTQTIDPTTTTSLSAVTPCRLLDTRRTPDAGRLGAQTRRIQVAGRCGVPIDARSVAVTIVAIEPVRDGFVTMWPTGAARPTASNVNFAPGNTVANSAVVELGAGGAVDVYVHAPVDLVVDVTAAFVPAATSTSGRFVPVEPTRLLDTRRTGQRGSTALRVPRPAGVDPDAVALAITITVVDASRPGFLTVHPQGSPRPLASVVNADLLDRTRANAMFAALGPDGLAVHRHMATDVVIDLWGWFTGASAPDATDGLFVPQPPTRVWDSRSSHDPVHPGGTIEKRLVPPKAAAMVANVTAVDMTRRGFVAAWAAGTPRPEVSSLNHRWPKPVAALTVSRTSTRGVAFHAHGGGAHLVVDLSGWFVGSPVAATGAVPSNRPPGATARVAVVSDSAFAGIRWNGALDRLQGAVFDARLESCRRVIGRSCRGREGYAPRNAIDEVRSLPFGYDIVVIATGYNDFAPFFPLGVDGVIEAARERGVQRVVWVTHREAVTYRAPGGLAYGSTFASHNRALRAAVASGSYPELTLADWHRYTIERPWWMTADGVHLNQVGARAAAEFVSRTIAAMNRRACPSGIGGVPAPGGWCARPDVTGPP